MRIVHHLENSRSQRLLWCLEEMGLPYEVKRYARDRKTMRAPSELKQVHPLGRSPVLEEDGTIRIESAAIIEHLVATTGKLGAPDEPDAKRRFAMFLHYAEGSLMPPLLALLVVGKLGLFGKPARGPMLAMFADHLRWLDSELGTREWFAGAEFSAADVMMSFPLEAARKRAGLDERFPNLLAWLDRIHARPAYQRALEVGGPYAYA